MSTTPTEAELKGMLDDLVEYVMKADPVELPQYRPDGEPVTKAEEVAAILGIPLSEAKARLVRDAAYWGVPVGTPITSGMKPMQRESKPVSSPSKPVRRYKKAALAKVIEHNGRPPTAYLKRGNRLGYTPAGIDPDDWEIAKGYWGEGVSRELNKLLRAGKPVVKKRMRSDNKPMQDYDLPAIRKALRRGISQGQIVQDAILWRGIYLKPSQAEMFQKPGIIRDKAFVSTSTSKEGVERVMRHRGRNDYKEGAKPYMLKILTPAGTPAIMGSPRVNEIILGENTPMRFVEMDGNVITLEVIQ